MDRLPHDAPAQGNQMEHAPAQANQVEDAPA